MEYLVVKQCGTYTSINYSSFANGSHAFCFSSFFPCSFKVVIDESLHFSGPKSEACKFCFRRCSRIMCRVLDEQQLHFSSISHNNSFLHSGDNTIHYSLHCSKLLLPLSSTIGPSFSPPPPSAEPD
ncbi:hypothetical protein OIU84_009902 [Salix udensis]|uniref:Uncharacterized protein n=1 Tax=Salix udensis TaxID=889485 RepID=A0AAD6JJI4_9ROSI|nr:hypothetical protein OIU84_009902 [Salix udensis]